MLRVVPVIGLVVLCAPCMGGPGVRVVHTASGSLLRAAGACALSGGDIALAGQRQTVAPSPITSALLSRCDPNGLPIWTLHVGSPGEMASGFAVREISGGMLAFGFYAGGGDRALCIAGVGAGGNLVWARRFAASNAIDGSAMEIDRATTGEMIVVAGRDTTPGLSGAILLSANAHDGSFAAESLYLPVSSEFSDLRYTDLCVMQNGDYFVTGSVGYASSMSTPDTDIVVARIDRASRNIVWCTVIAAAPPEGSDLASHDTGRGIVLTAEGMVAVVAGTQAPGTPPAALHLLIDPVTGAVLHHSVLSDVRVANASLVSLSTGQLLCAGGGDAAAGLSVAQMWRLDPSTLEVSWRGEYAEVESVGADAVELIDAGEPSIVLAGWQQLPGGIGLPVGLQGTMFTRADLDGHDGCAAVITTPKPPA